MGLDSSESFNGAPIRFLLLAGNLRTDSLRTAVLPGNLVFRTASHECVCDNQP